MSSDEFTYEHILYEIDGTVATVSLNRPKTMNAISLEMEDELHLALDRADDNPAVRTIILTGVGSAFSAGYDMGDGGATDDSGRRVSDPAGGSISDYIGYWHRRDAGDVEKLMHLWRLGKPVIAAVNGWAMGGGFWYQLAADITIASEQAVFAQPEVRQTSNTSVLFAFLCGWKVANRYSLTGDHIDAAEALRIGLVNEVVPHSELMSRARYLAERIGKVPEASIRANKAIAMLGLQASGLYSAMLLNGSLSAIAHSSHGHEREELLRARREGGLREYLNRRDGPFRPEPFGPKSHMPE